jgi:hypothetical protein
MRVRADWLAYTIVTVTLTACSSSKSAAPDDGGTADASAETAGKSPAAGNGASAGHAGKSGSGGATAGKGGAGQGASHNDDDAGPGVTNSQGSKGAAGKSGSDKGGSTGNAGQSGAGGQADTDDTAMSLPVTGDQLSLCTQADGDCNKGLSCGAPANIFSPGRGYCSKICTMDSDCSDVEPDAVKYTCTTGTGTKTCEVVCNGTDDTTSCPPALKCVRTGAAAPARGPARGAAGAGGAATAGAGGSGANAGEFRCRYPFATSPVWGECGDNVHVCDKGLSCHGSTFDRPGYCAPSCDMDADCKDKPGSGSVSPTCATIQPARGMTKAVKACVLDCSSAKDGCPTGTMCVDGPSTGAGMNAKPEYARCNY